MSQTPLHRRASGAHRGHGSTVLHWALRFGALGLFAVSVIDASIIPLPLPGSTDLLLLLLVVRGGNPWWMATAAVAGSIVGAYSTWATASKGGEAALKRYVPKRYSARLTGWMEHNGILTVAGAALLPPPIPLQPFLIAAGALRISLRRFLISFAVARTARYLLLAWLAHIYGHTIARLWTRYLARWSTPIEWAIALMVIGGSLFAVWRYRYSKTSALTNQAGPVAASRRSS